MRFLLSLIILIWGASTLLAQNIQTPRDLPPDLLDFAAETAARCEVNGVAVFPEDGFSRDFDFNRDGVQDYLISSRSFRCRPMGNSMYDGAAGNHYWVFISQPDGGFQEALHEAGHSLEFVQFFGPENPPALVFLHHGGSCGYSGATSCVGAVIWDTYQQRFVGTENQYTNPAYR